MRWFTSDLHLGHENIIGYCQRPFADVADMNASLIKNWNALVGTDDEVWVLGDFAMGVIEENLALIRHFAGRKVLVAGNHDRCWSGNPRQPLLWTQRYLDAGFARIEQGTVETAVAGTAVLAGHFPYVGDSHDEDRFTRFRPVDDGQWLLHGHVHTRWQVNGRQINVGVDKWGYAPVSEVQLAQIIRAAE